MALPNNTLLQGGKYKIVRFISSGGFGCTYEAEHVMLHKKVAIKEFFVKDFCNRDETTSEVSVGITSKTALVEKLKKKFIEEAQSLCSLEHPNIVHVFDVFEENGTAYYVMDYIDGPSLNDLVKKNGAMSESQAVAYIKQVADALGFVHSHNRLHLDIKPGNIMVDVNGKAILIDFGASKQYDEEAGENTSTLIGKTPGYAPLEQMGNDVVKFMPSTDIYALGATLYKILTGVTPPSATLLASGETLEDMPSVSVSTRNAIMEAMKTNKMKRPQSVDEFVKLLLPENANNSESVSENNDDNTLFEQEQIRQPKQQKEEEIRRKIEEEYRKKEELRLYEEERKRKKEEREKEEQRIEEEKKKVNHNRKIKSSKVWLWISLIFASAICGLCFLNSGPNDPEEQFKLAYNYHYGEGETQSDAKAIEWMRKAAEQGYAPAQNDLGVFYANGWGADKSEADAAIWYQKAAEQGYATAQLNMAQYYQYGIGGLNQSYVEAAKWYRKAADQGQEDAQAALGGCYYNGQGVKQSYKEAVKWYQKAAEHGQEDAQEMLGYCYYHGKGVKPSYVEAAKWYRKAAEQGSPSAQYTLANLYYYGEGVTQSCEEAVKWYRKTAEQGFVEACDRLGYLYMVGMGVTQSNEEAIKWYKKAAEKSYDWRREERLKELGAPGF